VSLYATCSRHSFGFSAEVRIPSRLAPACAGERDGTGRIGNAPRPGNLIISSWRATGLSPWRTVATVDARPFDGRRGQRRIPWRLATRHSRVPPAAPGRVPASFAAEAPWGPASAPTAAWPPPVRTWCLSEQGDSYQLRTAGWALHAPGQPPSPWPEAQSAGVSSASPGWAIPATSDIRGQIGAEPAAHVQPLLRASLSSPPERANSVALADIRPKGIAWLRLLPLAPRQTPDLAVRQEDEENPPQAKGGPSRGTG